MYPISLYISSLRSCIIRCRHATLLCPTPVSLLFFVQFFQRALFTPLLYFAPQLIHCASVSHCRQDVLLFYIVHEADHADADTASLFGC
ncbi:hypothetical protein BDN70DRAFT_454603 [Pholiota conissans]|uniref:Uncharacterized protein n=1 Tax=Pholiota conissans TaxID=109636 RepID=A0A9P5YNI6_9AGAR|nr:hypothetical protein BDN70DRAFT_454603 [Pholiota conissans]